MSEPGTPEEPLRRRLVMDSAPVSTRFVVPGCTYVAGPSLMATEASVLTTRGLPSLSSWPSTASVTRTWKLTVPLAARSASGMVQVTDVTTPSSDSDSLIEAPSGASPLNCALPSTYAVPAGTVSRTVTVADVAAPVASTAVLSHVIS